LFKLSKIKINSQWIPGYPGCATTWKKLVVHIRVKPSSVYESTFDVQTG